MRGNRSYMIRNVASLWLLIVVFVSLVNSLEWFIVNVCSNCQCSVVIFNFNSRLCATNRFKAPSYLFEQTTSEVFMGLKKPVFTHCYS